MKISHWASGSLLTVLGLLATPTNGDAQSACGCTQQDKTDIESRIKQADAAMSEYDALIKEWETKEKGAGDAADQDVTVQPFVTFPRAIGIVRLILGKERPAVCLDGNGLGHAMQHEKRRQAEAGQDAIDEIAEDGDEESGHQHQCIGPRGADEGREGMLFGHIPADYRQHGGKRRKRNVAGQRRREQQEQQQEEGMQHSGDRPSGPGTDVGRSARDRTRHADSAEERRGDIGRALRNQFGV